MNQQILPQAPRPVLRQPGRSPMRQRNNPLNNYAKSLLNPFATDVAQPKIYDGKVLRSAGIRFRTTGEITLTQPITYIVLSPALSAPMTYYNSAAYTVPSEAGVIHIGTSTDRGYIEKLRMVGCGLKLNLMNSFDQNEGYWEAARFTTTSTDYAIEGAGTGRVKYNPLSSGTPPYAGMELTNEPSYQRGKLRDIHKYLFRLNSNNTEHNLGRIDSAAPTVPQLVDEDWDTIIIKLHGRVEVGSPSVVNYEVVNNQEVVYKSGTPIARLMTPSPFIPATSVVMGKIKIGMPGLKVE